MANQENLLSSEKYKTKMVKLPVSYISKKTKENISPIGSSNQSNESTRGSASSIEKENIVPTPGSSKVHHISRGAIITSEKNQPEFSTCNCSCNCTKCNSKDSKDTKDVLKDIFDKVSYIFQQTKKQEMEKRLYKTIKGKLPLKTVEDLEAFELSLCRREAKDEFKNIVATASLKDILSDDLILQYKLNPSKGKKGLKEFIFYQLWKEASPLPCDAFEAVVKAQLRGGKSRKYSAKYLSKKKLKNACEEEAQEKDDADEQGAQKNKIFECEVQDRTRENEDTDTD